ncbi:MAG: hypothetical protein AAF665_08585 [Pseudomonadota bacterium]
MTIHHDAQNDYMLATSLDLIRSNGVKIVTGSDFEEYRKILSVARPDHKLGVPFDPNRQSLNVANAFWIVGLDEDENIVHTQALKTLHLPDTSLGEYMSNNLRAFEPPLDDIDYGKTTYRPGPGAKRIRGMITYHGEFWLGGEAGQFRGTGMSTLLARHAFLTAILRWDPDYFFGLMSKPLVLKGFSARFGYMHTDPDAIRFARKEVDELFEVVMGYMTNEDLRFLLEMPEPNAMKEAA